MTVWAWMRLSVCWWLLRKAARAARWLLLAAAVVAAWPVTVVAAAGYAVAWLRGWPPARLRRAAAWSLPATVVWLLGEALVRRGWRPVVLAPADGWAHGWQQLTGIGLARTFALLAPVTVPAGLGLAAGLWG